MVAKRVLVTGSSRGIGKAIALTIAQSGYEVVVHCRENMEAAEKTVQAIQDQNQKASLLQFDVSDRAACKATLEKDMETHGVYFGVVCNAGIARDKPFPRIKPEDWDDVMATNLDSFYNVIHPVVMPMVRAKNKGRIITMSSISGITGNRGQVNYSAAKAGIIGATKALAQELAKREITVNCVAPGIIETDMVRDLPLEEIKRMIPMRRLGKPEEVASIVNFLLSEGAGYMTGQVISPNGGLI